MDFDVTGMTLGPKVWLNVADEFDADAELEMNIEVIGGSETYAYPTVAQVIQLRDRLTELLDQHAAHYPKEN